MSEEYRIVSEAILALSKVRMAAQAVVMHWAALGAGHGFEAHLAVLEKQLERFAALEREAATAEAP